MKSGCETHFDVCLEDELSAAGTSVRSCSTKKSCMRKRRRVKELGRG